MSTIDTDPGPEGASSDRPREGSPAAEPALAVLATATKPLPTGTVTFVFTDIEGSTRLLQDLGEEYRAVLEGQRRLITEAAEQGGGQAFGSEGDALFLVFRSAMSAAGAAVAAQRALAAETWPHDVAVRVRMGVHTGEATLLGDDYIGLDLHRTARITAAGHGGQVLISSSTRELVDHALPEGVKLRDLGPRRLKDLSRPERIYQLIVPDLLQDFPALRTLDALPNNLPTQLTSFVGRSREVAEARRLLQGTRLLTLTGPGGTGKTRLSLQVAADEIEAFPDGVFFVPLAPVSDPELVPSVILHELGIQDVGQRTPLDRLIDHLREKKLLLVLDNFEQIVPAAPVVSDMLKASPSLKCIVTTRAILHLYGEQEFPVPPLDLPPDPANLPNLEALSQFESVKLFIERAVAVKPDFVVTNANAPVVAEIAARLDGLPLAIELAAARVRLLPPQALLARLGSRLGLLGSTGMARDLPERQQTLRGAIMWSHDLLDESARRLFARASVFVGGFGFDQAEAVCGPTDELGTDVLDGLSGLVDQSLIRQEEWDGEPRFMMLETIREFAQERLVESGEADEIRRRHADVYLALAELACPNLLGEQQKEWLDRLEREVGNLRAALGCSIDRNDAAVACRLAYALWRFWQIRGHLKEGRNWVERVLDLALTGDVPRERGMALEAAGGIAYWQSDFQAAERFYEEALELQRAAGDEAGTANALYNLSFVYAVPMTDLNKARALLEESRVIYERLGDRAGQGRVLWGLANSVLTNQNDFELAQRYNEASIEIFRELGDQFGLGWALHGRAFIGLRRDDVGGIKPALDEGLRLFGSTGDIPGVTVLLDDMSLLAVREGQFERAATLSGAATALQAQSGSDLAGFIANLYSQPRPDGSAPAEESLARAWERGRSMSLEQAVDFAIGDERESAAPHDAA